jgi:hypothetical protein
MVFSFMNKPIEKQGHEGCISVTSTISDDAEDLCCVALWPLWSVSTTKTANNGG